MNVPRPQPQTADLATDEGQAKTPYAILRAAHIGAWNRLSSFDWQHVARIARTLTTGQAELIASWLARSNDLPHPGAATADDPTQGLAIAIEYPGSGRSARLALRCALLATDVHLTAAEAAETDCLADQLLDDAWLVAGWIFRTRRPHVDPGDYPTY